MLSDPDTRRVYDTRGEAGLNEQGGMGGMDPQVRSRNAVKLTHCLRFIIFRTSSVSYSVVGEADSVVVGSLVEEAVHQEDQEKPKTSFIASTSL